jgi:lysozyme
LTPGLMISQAQADQLLLDDLADAIAGVNRAVTVEICQCQFDALVDFCFNAGCGSLLGSTLLKKLNKGDVAGAAAQFSLWVHAGGKVVPGLVRRRKEEAALFLSASTSTSASPSASASAPADVARPSS